MLITDKDIDEALHSIECVECKTFFQENRDVLKKVLSDFADCGYTVIKTNSHAGSSELTKCVFGLHKVLEAHLRKVFPKITTPELIQYIAPVSNKIMHCGYEIARMRFDSKK